MSGNNEELRKKITSARRAGIRLYHSANNRGHFQNTVMEQVLTTEILSDRALGTNDITTGTNEMDFSISGNTGITMTADLQARTREIRLFLKQEDANNRNFEIQDLWGYVLKNRAKILSAIYTLYSSWYDAGCPEYEGVTFTSFPEWARTTGNVMVHHNIGNPTLAQEGDNIGGDLETKSMKALYELLMSEKNNMCVSGLHMADMISYVGECHKRGDSLFPWIDTTTRAGATKLSISIRRFLGRELGGIVMECVDTTITGRNQLFTLKKEVVQPPQPQQRSNPQKLLRDVKKEYRDSHNVVKVDGVAEKLDVGTEELQETLKQQEQEKPQELKKQPHDWVLAPTEKKGVCSHCNWEKTLAYAKQGSTEPTICYGCYGAFH